MTLGANAALTAARWQRISGPSATTLTLNADGAVTVPAGAEPGVYVYSYEICALPHSTPCSASTVTVSVGNAAPVPALSPWSLLGLSALVLAAGGLRRGRFFAPQAVVNKWKPNFAY